MPMYKLYNNQSKSIASSDIANSLSDEKKWAKLDSIKKRIYRFWNNTMG